MIDRKDLRTGLVTTEGFTVTKIGDDHLLYTHTTGGEFCELISIFCNKYTEAKEDIVEVELVASSGGHTYLVDSKNRLMPDFSIKIEAIRTGIKLYYSKTKGEFVTVDKCEEGGLVDVMSFS